MRKNFYIATAIIITCIGCMACATSSTVKKDVEPVTVDTTLTVDTSVSEEVTTEPTTTKKDTTTVVVDNETTVNTNNESSSIKETTSKKEEMTTTKQSQTTSKKEEQTTTKQSQTTSKKEESTTSKKQEETTTKPKETTSKVEEQTTTKQPETTTKPKETTTKKEESTSKKEEETTTTKVSAERLKAIVNSAEFKHMLEYEMVKGRYEVWYEDKYLPDLGKYIPAGIYLFENDDETDMVAMAVNKNNGDRVDIILNNTQYTDILAGYINIGYIEYDWLMEHYWNMEY